MITQPRGGGGVQEAASPTGPGPLVGPAAVTSWSSLSSTEALPKEVVFQLRPGGGGFKQKKQQVGTRFCHQLDFVAVVDSEEGRQDIQR